MVDIDNQTSETSNGLRSIKDIIKDLSKPVAKRHLGKRKQGGKEIPFISWDTAVRYMDYLAGVWNYQIMRVDNIAGKVILTVRVSILSKEGWMFREATGQEDESVESYGDSSSNAESMALRRACAKFGLGLYLYDDLSPYNPAGHCYNANWDAKPKDEVKQAQSVSNASEKAIEPQIPQAVKANPALGAKGSTSVTVKTTPVPVKEKRSNLTDAQLSSLIAMTTKFSEKGINEKDIALEVSQGEFSSYDELDMLEASEAIRLIQAKVKQ